MTRTKTTAIPNEYPEVTRKPWTVLSMLERVTTHFEKHQVPNPRLSIEWLLADLLELKRLDLYLNYDRPLSDREIEALRPLVKRRTDHEPLQYITGSTDFLGTRIRVDKRVLIPRHETEQLTELLLTDSADASEKPLTVLDIGTGSGCIAIAIAKARPAWRVTALDKSADALTLASENAGMNDVSVRFVSGDLFELEKSDLSELSPFDIIVSNPPYILPGEKPDLEPQVLEYEPAEALFHEEPVTVCRTIAQYASHHLRPNGCLYLECNAALTVETADRIGHFFDHLDVVKDYDEKDRFIRAVKASG